MQHLYFLISANAALVAVACINSIVFN